MGIGDKNYLGENYQFKPSGNNAPADLYAGTAPSGTYEPLNEKIFNAALNSLQGWIADSKRDYLNNQNSDFNTYGNAELMMAGKEPNNSGSLSEEDANSMAQEAVNIEKNIARRNKDRDEKWYGGDVGAYDDIINSETLTEVDKAKNSVSTKQAQAKADELYDRDRTNYDTSGYADAIRKEWNGQRGIVPSTEDMYNEWVAATYEPGTFGYESFWDFSGPESNSQDWYDFTRWADQNYGAYSDARDYFDSLENFESGWFNPTKAQNNILDYFNTGANAQMFGTTYADIENAAANIANLGLPLFSLDGTTAISPEDPGYLDALTAQMSLAAMGYGANNPYAITPQEWNKMSDAFTNVGASDVEYRGFDNDKFNYLSNEGITPEDLASLNNTNFMDYGLWANNPEMLTYLSNALAQQAGYGNNYQIPEGKTAEDILTETFGERQKPETKDK